MSILLKQQSDSLIINTGNTSVLGYSITYSVTGNKTYTNSADGTIEAAGDTTVLNGPNPNYFYEITNISIVNNGTASTTIQVKKNSDPLCSTGIVLSSGESLIYSGVWNYNNSDGSTIINLSGTINAQIVNASGDSLATTKLASEEQQVLGNDSLVTLIEKISTESKQDEIIEAIEGIAVIGTGVGSVVLSAAYLTAGKTLRIMGGGIFSTIVAPGNVTVKVKLNAVVIATGVITNILSLASNNAFDFYGEITCRSTGVTGTVNTNGKVNYDTGVLVQGALALNNAGVNAVVDTTIGQTLDVTITWSTADAGNTISSTTLSVEVLN